MCSRNKLLCISGILAAIVFATVASGQAQKDRSALVITFKDGHQQTFSLGDISRIEFKGTAASAKSPATGGSEGRGRFLGKWRFGDGNGSTFEVTLNPNGEAIKSHGAPHGTWTVVDGEARISWDDGWHDALRKVGTKYEKFAYEPGKSFSDEPSNVTDAKNLEAEPI